MGSSAISLVTKNIHYDGTCAPIDLSRPKESAFALDGVRLVANAGALASTYHYETARGRILVKKHMAGNNVAYFTVAYPDGNTATFGFADNTDMRVVYPITELKDIRGNTVSFQYTMSGNSYYLSRIMYGGNSASAHLAEIECIYEDRTDFGALYVSGLKVSADKILKKIISRTVADGGMQELCSYTLTHRGDSHANRLVKLDCSSGGESLRPLTFSYIADRNSAAAGMERNGHLMLEKFFSEKSGAQPVFIRGKFVKDRYDDGMVTFPGRFTAYDIVGYRKSGSKLYPVFGSGFPKDQTILIASAISSLSYVDSIRTEAGFQTIQALDIDGDDTDEIVKVNISGNDKEKTTLTLKTYRRGNDGFAEQSFNVDVKGVVNSGNGTYSPMFRSYLWGDFRGDGKKQLLSVAHNVTSFGDKQTSYFALVDLAGKTLVSETSPFTFADEDMKCTFVLDVNGDGKAELCHVTGSSLDVYALYGNSFVKTGSMPFMDRSKFGERAFFGDINGDGYIDVVVSPEKSYEKFEDRLIPVWTPENCTSCGSADPIVDMSRTTCRFCNFNLKGYCLSKHYRAVCRRCGAALEVSADRKSASCLYDGESVNCRCDIGFVNNGNVWQTYTNTGAGFAVSSVTLDTRHTDDEYVLMDINRDGYADLVRSRNGSIEVFLSDRGLLQNKAACTVSAVQAATAASLEMLPANVCEYGSMSHFITIANADITCYSYSKDFVRDNLLTELTDSYGNVYGSEYGLLPVKKTLYTGPNKANETRWTYDAHGNVTSEMSAPYDVKAFNGKTYEYDADGRYVTTIADELGLRTQYADFDKYGNARTVTDFRSNKTRIEYDAWGRQTLAVRPDRTEERTVVAWGGEGLYTVTKVQSGKPVVVTHYDSRQRDVRTCSQRFDGKWQTVDKVYDERGRLSKVSLPFIGSAPAYWNVYTYDDYDRLLSFDEASGKSTTWSYDQSKTTETKDGISTIRTVDASGCVVMAEDAGGAVVYNLRSDDQPESIVAPGNVVTSFTYDEYGRKTSVNDPSFGVQVTEEAWSADGSHTQTQIDADGRTTTAYYDCLGRKSREVRPEFVTFYDYDLYGCLKSVLSTNGTRHEYAYNDYGQTEFIESRIGNKRKTDAFKYQYGNVVEKTMHLVTESGDKTVDETYQYANGSLVRIALASGETVWQLLDENEFGQPAQIVTGTMQRKYVYTPYGLPALRIAGNIQSEQYQFDTRSGNLLLRVNVKRNQAEQFGYDSLNRLVWANGRRVNYAANGNVLARTDVGTYEYGITGKPYAVSGIAYGSGSYANRSGYDIEYNSLHRPASIDNGLKTTFEYDAAGDRVVMRKGSAEKFYLGEYEVWNSGERQVLYLAGDAYTAPVALVKNGGSADWQLVNICRDYLGSIMYIASCDGQLIAEYSYDAWGNLRDPQTWNNYPADVTPPLYLDRGYTGHEHLREYGLINMNARLYDPETGRFLSPDPYVQSPDFTQSYNRYTYCMNNPMKYVDESGEIFFLLTIATAVVNTFSNVFQHGLNFSRYNWNKTINAWNIDMGMFRGNVLQVLNKWTFGFINSYVGNTIAHTLNITGNIEGVTYMDGMLALSGVTGRENSAFTIGHYSFGPNNYVADWRDHLFVHEYGHYVQSQHFGFTYLAIVGVPSLVSAGGIFSPKDHHAKRWFEKDANALGAKFFDKKYGRGAKGYKKGSSEFFDLDSYKEGKNAKTPYINPRTNSYIQDKPNYYRY